jgi:ornithine decarboxylase
MNEVRIQDTKNSQDKTSEKSNEKIEGSRKGVSTRRSQVVSPKSYASMAAVYQATPADHPIWQVPSPGLILSPKRAVANYQAIQRAFPGALVGYTVKSNPHPALLEALSHVKDAYFEVASRAEIESLVKLGVKGEQIYYSNPVKQLSHIRAAVEMGVTHFAYDSEAEVEKLASFGLPLEVYVRMTVPHTGALWPLTHKFGVEPFKAVSLLKLAKEQGLKPVGMAFHVGSQCNRADTWAEALRAIAPAWQMAQEAGLELDLIDLGGGFPAPYFNPVMHPRDVAAVVNPLLQACVPGAKRVFLEPGRGVSATAADMVLEITGIAERPDGQTWLYLDGGVFTGLYEIPDGIRPQVQPMIRETRPLGLRTYRLAGPTCDSMDTMFEMRSPVELKIGDRLVLKACGAYVYNVGSPFNGFPIPETVEDSEWMVNLDEFVGIC